MERIIYNNKLKKLFISMLVVMLLMTYVMPIKVLAAEITKTDYEYSYNDWITGEDTKKYKDDIEDATIDALGNGLLKHIEDSTEREDEAKKLLTDKPDEIRINATLNIDFVCLGNRFNIASLTIKTEEVEEYIPETKKYNELIEWSPKTDDEVYEEVIQVIMKDPQLVGKDQIGGGYTARDAAEKLLELNKETIEFTVVGENNDYTITDYSIPGKNSETAFREVCAELGIPYDSEEAKEDSANLGGILLSPVFYLINFIADAITSNLGRIMYGENINVFSGIGVLTATYDSSKYNTTNPARFDVDIKSFLPNFGGVLSDITYQYPNITYTPEEIFAGKIDLLSIDFISGKNYEGVQNQNSDWNSIRTVISQWYQILRMIAIIGLLSVLIYMGIKIIISANAKDKAKYKEWIIDWFMAVAILFSMHIIMAFIISVTGELSKLIGGSFQGINVVLLKDGVETGDSFVTNLMGLVRFMIQSENFYMKVGYEVMYIALLVYTIKFTVTYLKRVLNMAFLTIIAPIVALTYPIDKVNDGKAQGFDMWLKEYIFNALLQPMHQIMYYVLVGSAVGIAASNPIYGIVVLAFMSEAEKLLKKIFGFEKASAGTVGGMTGAFAAGAIASNIKNIARLAGGGKGNGGGGPGGDKPSAIDSPKPSDKPKFNEVFDANDESGDENPPEGSNQEQESVEPRMLEAYDEKFGTDEYDPAEREAMAREVYQPESREYTADEYRQILEDTGYEGEDLEEEMRKAGYVQDEAPESEHEQEQEQEQDHGTQTPPQEPQTPPQQQQIPQQDSNQEESRRVKGAKAVGKKLLKPIWDLEKSKSYNYKRLGKGALKGIAKGVGGFALGTAAAAVQAGISITDGKYNPMEGMATFAAGYAGASHVTNRVESGIGSLIDTYREGADAGDKVAQMERAQKRFADRDDVIEFNKREYTSQKEHYTAKDYMERERDHYLTAGITDLKDMKKCMKYADSLVGTTEGMTSEQIKEARKKADRKAAATLDFRKTLQDQGQLSAIYDKDKQAKYIESMVKQAERNGDDGAKIKRQYENAFKSIAAYDSANA